MSFLQLEDYFISRLHVDFEFPKEEEATVKKLSLDFDYEVLEHAESPLRRLLRLRVRVTELAGDGQPVGHRIDCEINGDFVIPEEIEEAKREGLLRVNGVSILYSTLRGIIGNLSGSFPVGRLCLPTILPQEVVKQIEARKAEDRETAKPKKAATRKKLTKRTTSKRSSS